MSSNGQGCGPTYRLWQMVTNQDGSHDTAHRNHSKVNGPHHIFVQPHYSRMFNVLTPSNATMLLIRENRGCLHPHGLTA